MEYYSYDPEDGFETHKTAEEARARALRAIEDARPGQGDFWHPDMDEIQWGRLTLYESAVAVDTRPVVREDENGVEHESKYDFTCDYTLKPFENAPRGGREGLLCVAQEVGLIASDSSFCPSVEWIVSRIRDIKRDRDSAIDSRDAAIRALKRVR